MYRGTASALAEHRTARHHPVWALTIWPAIELFGFYLDSFMAAFQRHNRQREYAADRVGARITNSKTLAVALVKLHYLYGQWEALRTAAARASARGRLPENLSQWWVDTLAQEFNTAAVSRLAGQAVNHPTDEHPPLAKRLHRIHEKIDTIAADVHEMTPADAAIDPPDSASRGTRGGIEHGLPGDADLVLRLQSSQAASVV